MKKILFLSISILLIITTIHSVEATSKAEIDIKADYAMVIDKEQNTVVYEKNADKKMYPASMTKVITVIVALEMIEDLDKTVTITARDLETLFETGASTAYFEIGEVVTYRDLLYGAMLPSGADATRALAFNLSGSLEAFVEEMNLFTKTLALDNTHFVNTTGIHDDKHYTTVRDVTKILQYCLENPDFVEIFNTYSYTSRNQLHNWVNGGKHRAKLAGYDISRIIGCKSGFTDEAANCLVSLVEANGRELIMVVGHSEDEKKTSAVVDTNVLIDYCEEQFDEIQLFKAGDTIEETTITYGKIENYAFTFDNEVIIYAPKGTTLENTEELSYTYSYEELKAPITKGTVMGNLKITYQGEIVYTQDLVVNKDIERKLFSYLISKVIDFIFPYGLGIVCIILCMSILRRKPKRRTR